MFEQTGENVIATITHDIEDSLKNLVPRTEEYTHPGTPLVTRVELEDVQRAPPMGPQRHGSYSYPGFSGYSPAGVFAKVVKNALRKARRRQAQGVTADARVLVVNLMQTKIADDLTHPVHLDEAEQQLDPVDPRDYGLDAITFIVRALPHGLAALLTVMDDTTLTKAQIEAMFGASPPTGEG
jgi:hypothetical protein